MPKPDKAGAEFSRDREFKVILEDFQSQFRVFGEGMQDIRRNLQDFREEFVGFRQEACGRLIRIETSLDRFFNQLSDHETRITTLEKTAG